MSDSGMTGIQVNQSEPVLFQSESVFSKYFLIGVSCGTVFLYRRKELGYANLSSTLNMFVQSTEYFLEAFEKVSAQNMKFCQNIPICC